MKKRSTDELMKILESSDTINQYLTENRDFLISCSLSEYLNRLLTEKRLLKSAVIRQAELNEIYGYQLFSGTRVPSRDKLLALCIGMTLNLEETQQTLKIAGFAPLYPKNKRDSIIIMGIQNCHSICKINESLYDFGEFTLK